MKTFVITTNNGFWEHGATVKAGSKEEAVQIFKTAPQYKIFRGEEIVSVETDAEAGIVYEND